jgi:hypothetical protein
VVQSVPQEQALSKGWLMTFACAPFAGCGMLCTVTLRRQFCRWLTVAPLLPRCSRQALPPPLVPSLPRPSRHRCLPAPTELLYTLQGVMISVTHTELVVDDHNHRAQ